MLNTIFVQSTDISVDSLVDHFYTYGGSGDDDGYAMERTTDGGYILCGVTGSEGPNARIYLVKTGKYGTVEWSQSYGGSGIDYFGYDVKQTTDGGYVVAGYLDLIYPGNWIAILLKTTSTGSMQWVRYFSEAPVVDKFHSVQQTSDNGYIMTGGTWSVQEYDSRWPDLWVVKADASGIKQWSKRYGSANWDIGYDIQTCTDGGYIVCGHRSYPYEPWVVKLDSGGNKVWETTIDTDEYARSIKQTVDGGYIVTGGLTDLWVSKLTDSGDIEWTKEYDSGLGYEVFECSVGGYVILGSSVMRTDASGEMMFKDSYFTAWDGVEIEQGYCAIVGSDDSDGDSDMALQLVSLDHQPPDVAITKPEDGLYLGNSRILPLHNLIILIGDMTIEIDTTDLFSGVLYVEYYVDDVLIGSQTGGSYRFDWMEKTIGRYTIKVTAYDICGNQASDEITIFNIF